MGQSFRFEQGPQHSLQIFAGAVEAGFYGREFGVHGAADFVEGEFFIFGEDEDVALQRGKEGDGLGDDGGTLTVGDIEGGGDGNVVVEIAEGSFAAGAFESQIPGDAEEKAAECAAVTVEGGGVAEESDEGVVDEVFGGGRRAGHSPGEAEEDVFVGGIGDLEIGVRHC
jgi:hypothetical protein